MVREKVKASSYFLQFIFVYLYSTYVLWHLKKSKILLRLYFRSDGI